MALASLPMETSIQLYKEVMVELHDKRISQRLIASGSGVPFSTLTKIAQGRIKAPSVHHVQAIYDFFKNQQATRGAVTRYDLRPDVFGESADESNQPTREAA